MGRPDAGSVEERARNLSRQRRQERKAKQQLAVKTGVWDRCRFRVPGKERFCAQQRVSENAEFCATHTPASSSSDGGRRVPCPLDPNHNVAERLLESHVKICNKTRQSKELEQQPYYSKDINSGKPGNCQDCDSGATQGYAGGEEATGGACNALGKTAPLDEAFVLDLITRVSAAHREHVGDLPMEVLDPPEVQALHRTVVEGGVGFRKGRHVVQQASIVGHMLKRGLVGPATRSLYVEMGAGRGALGQAIATAFPGSEITMIERSSVRRKADKKLDGVSTRARIDIRDLNMAGLPSLTTTEGEQRPVVAVAKHLCGVATDLALRAMLTLSPEQIVPLAEKAPREGDEIGKCPVSKPGRPSVSAADTDSEKIRSTESASLESYGGRVGGVAIATCCHHACAWRDYVGQGFLLKLGFNARDFETMRRISGWISQEPESAAAIHGPAEAQSSTTANSLKDPRAPQQQQSGENDATSTNEAATEPEGMAKTAVKEETRISWFPSPQQPHRPVDSDHCDGTEHCDDGSERTHEAYDANRTRPLAGAGAPRQRDEEDLGALPALSAAAKATAARDCKRLLDRGRVWFVQGKLGLTCEIVHFVEREVTPENALLLAFRA